MLHLRAEAADAFNGANLQLCILSITRILSGMYA